MSPFTFLLPETAVVVEANSPDDWNAGLLAEEALYIANAVPQRKREFTAGRNCARRALNLLGFPAIEIGVGPGRQPLFPKDISGTITHTNDYCAAAVIQRGDVLSIGIDAEPLEALSLDVVDLILLPQEKEMIGNIGGDGFQDKIIFSIKEAFYKAYFQCSSTYLDFLDAQVHLVAGCNEFSIFILKNNVREYFRGASFHGRYQISGRLIYTAIALPAA